MPKQIILEYPWKAVLTKNNKMYEISHYYSFEIITWSVTLRNLYFNRPHDLLLFDFEKVPDNAKSIITQCQTELNNQQ
jgi:hypothetical protein